VADITCLKTDRHFADLESLDLCKKEHKDCLTCPWLKTPAEIKAKPIPRKEPQTPLSIFYPITIEPKTTTTPNSGAIERMVMSDETYKLQAQIDLITCPSCKKKSLWFNQSINKYECLNLKDCGQTFFKESIEKYNRQIEQAKLELDSLTEKDTKSWFQNQYFDPKKKKWRDGKAKSVSLGHNQWLWIVIFFVLLGLAITLLLSYFFPGTRFAIFVW
jgi:hypothetical protein